MLVAKTSLAQTHVGSRIELRTAFDGLWPFGTLVQEGTLAAGVAQGTGALLRIN